MFDCFVSRSQKAEEVMVELLKTYSTENAAEAKEDAERCVIVALGDPSTYLFDHLLPLKPILALEGTKLHRMLRIFVEGSYHDYMIFNQEDPDYVEKLGEIFSCFGQDVIRR